MAYLRGGAYVDGNLNVEGKINVKSVSVSDNEVPQINENRDKLQYNLVQFSDTENVKLTTSALASVVRADSSSETLNYVESIILRGSNEAFAQNNNPNVLRVEISKDSTLTNTDVLIEATATAQKFYATPDNISVKKKDLYLWDDPTKPNCDNKWHYSQQA